MILRDIVDLINCEFNMYIRGIKLINNKNVKIPDSILNMEIEKIDFTDSIDIYLLETC